VKFSLKVYVEFTESFLSSSYSFFSHFFFDNLSHKNDYSISLICSSESEAIQDIDKKIFGQLNSKVPFVLDDLIIIFFISDSCIWKKESSLFV
jgi:hypothetical protein